MLDSKIRGHWDRLMKPVGRGLGRIGLTPNAITLGGVLFQAAVAALILDGKLLVAGLVAIVAALADGLDGAVAKAMGARSDFGAVLDSTTDRLAEALYYLPIAWLYGVSPDIAERDEPWVAALALTAMVLAFLVSYIRARAESLGYDAKVGIAERAERAIILILGLILDLVPLSLILLASASAVTFLQRLVHVRRQTAIHRGER
jgi:CDP-diacylglycerol---glycerol-3-phosphate 3-phosphatidyltransferase